MKRAFGLLAVLVLLQPALMVEEAAPREQQGEVSFRALDLWVDAGDSPLAAYQVECNYNPGQVKIVGIEGGEAKAYNPAPYYDRAGKTGGRIIIAAFTIEDEEAPRGRTRVARLHLRVEGEGDVDVSLSLVTAARPGGERTNPEVSLQAPQGREE